MFQQFLKLTFRNLWRSKGFSLLNIAGLGAGLCVALLIGLWIADELSYDRFHENRDYLYQMKMTDVVNGQKATWNSVPLALAEELRRSFPQVKRVAAADWGWEHGLKRDDRVFFKNGLQVEPDFLHMFSFPLLAGDLRTALEKPNSIVLTAAMAEALFGHRNFADMLGQTIKADNLFDVEVTGVMQDVPDNSTLQFHFLLPFSLYEGSMDWVKESRSNWGNFAFQVFLELQEGVTQAGFAPQVKDLVKRNIPESKVELTLHSVKDWRLYDKFENGKIAGGFIEYVRLFGIIGFIVLLIACINFMNLSTARSERRSKEVGVRKTLGSSRGRLISQFLWEAVVMAIGAFSLAALIAELVLPGFNTLTGKALTVPYHSAAFWGMSLSVTVLAGLLAGSYPAFFLSSFQPVRVLKGSAAGVGKAALLPRKVLVVSQFAVSTALIVSTLVVHQQIQHAKNRPSGYNPDRVVMVTLTGDLIDKYEPLKNELLSGGMVTHVTKASSPITQVYANIRDVDWKGKDPNDDALFALTATSQDYFETLGLQIVQGRFFNASHPGDTGAVIFNETAVARMGMEKPLEETVVWNGRTLRVVGVVADVIMNNPFSKTGPAMYLFDPNWQNDMMFRLSPQADTRKVLAAMEPVFRRYNPAYPFEYRFADVEYGYKFRSEETIGRLAALFAGLAIFISCLGLFGLAAYMAERRVKEIGIRKVLGASTSQLWALLSREFAVLVFISSMIAVPASAWMLTRWLEKFEYRIDLSWWMFLFAGVAALAVALLTVSFQSVRAALANPVESLRSE